MMFFAGCMFIGIGLGFVFNHVAAGTLIGMGAGFVLEGVMKWRKK